VTSWETIKYNHGTFYESVKKQGKPVGGMGIFDDNPLRKDIEEAAILSGLDVMINCVVNMWGEAVAVFAGGLKPAYAAAVQEAKTHYLTSRVREKDIVIANTFAKGNEAFIGVQIAYPSVKPGGGDVVLVANVPEGQVIHYLLGPFGKTTSGPFQRESSIPEHVNRLIVYTEYPDLASRAWYGNPDKVMFLYKWDDVLRVLQESHGSDTEVVVYPNAEIQYCAQQSA
jgi:nickel-dependent lactate racemase